MCTPARIPGAQACIAQTWPSSTASPSGVSSRIQFTIHAQSDHQWLAVSRDARPLRQREALLQAARFVLVPLGQIAAAVFHARSCGDRTGWRRSPQMLAVAVTEQVRAYASLRML